jgi:type II secretory pathway component PulJ
VRRQKLQTGFTIVEVLISLSVTGLIMFVVADFMINNILQSSLADARYTQAREVEQSLDIVSKDIRLSANADDNNRWPDPYAPDGNNPFSWTSNSSTLVLATAAEDASGNIIFSDAKNYVTEKNNIIYFVKNGTLYKRVLASPVGGNTAKTTCPAAAATAQCPADKELLHNITVFSFNYLDGQNNNVSPTDARAIQAQVTVSKDIFKHDVNTSYTTRMVFRND